MSEKTRPSSPQDGSTLSAGLAQLGLALEASQIDRLLAHGQAIRRANQALNLVSHGDLPRLVVRHTLDSLTIVPQIRVGPGTTLLDAGSGGGFPGIPVAIVYPRCAVYLVESNQKKAAFLIRLCQQLELHNVTVLPVRLEELHHSSQILFDIVLARALRPPTRLLALLTPLLKPGGLVAVYVSARQPLPPGYQQRVLIAAPLSLEQRAFLFYRSGL